MRGEAFIIGVRPRVLPERILKEEPWREELRKLLLEYVSLALFPTAYGIREVVEVLQELRDLMLLDGVDNTLVGEAMDQIGRWIEFAKKGEEFDLAGVLRTIRRFAESDIEGWEDGGKG